ncbi:MAG TPA: prohibitin family protein [Cytophagaceae bacterium]|jgi:prohibitin 1|nr:prohibitin family protein [Cytophagaceae bacterium]
MKKIILLPLVILVLQGCMIVRPGQIGYIQRNGKLLPKPSLGGSRWFNPFTSKTVKINTRTVELYNELTVPSKEGLSVKAEISLLYHIDKESARDIYIRFGINYEEVVILSNLRATTREICAKYEAKELYATERNKIEKAIYDHLVEQLTQYGFVIDVVLLRDIFMPEQLTRAIQNKLEAEQSALTMDFVIQKQRKEAERLLIEADAIKKSQTIINEALTQNALQYRYIDMLKVLGNSNNSKLIFIDKNSPLQLNTDLLPSGVK